MDRRDFLKTVGLGAAAMAVPLPFKMLPTPKHPMLPAHLDYWGVHLSGSNCYPSMNMGVGAYDKLVEIYPPAYGFDERKLTSSERIARGWSPQPEHRPYIWADWCFRTKEEGVKFRKYVESLGIEPWKSHPHAQRAVDRLTKEQFDYWRRILGDNTSQISIDYRCLMVMDEEQIRIVERAEEMTEEEFVTYYNDSLVNVAKRMYKEAKEKGYDSDFDGCREELEPHIDAPELEKLSFSLWEDLIYNEDSYETYIKEGYFDHTCKEVGSKFTTMV